MRKNIENRPSHVTTGNVFDDLGLSSKEALEAKIKSDILQAIMARTEKLGITQSELARRLKVHQPDVSNLVNGKISRFSISKLIQFAAHLNLHAEVRVTANKGPEMRRVSRNATRAHAHA